MTLFQGESNLKKLLLHIFRFHILFDHSHTNKKIKIKNNLNLKLLLKYLKVLKIKT